MKYTVIWMPKAENQLVALWSDARHRAAVTQAANAIDAMLASGPEDLGESRAGITRILIEAPLGVFFKVHEQDRMVQVLTVWRIARRDGAG